MPLKVIPAGKQDARRAVDIENVAYNDDPYGPFLFPGPHTETEGAARSERLAANLDQSPFCRWMQVVDDDLVAQGKEGMISFSMWYVWDKPPPKEEHQRPAPLWGAGANAEACDLFFGGMSAKWFDRLGGKPHVYLKLLHTDPEQQKRGAGSMLLKWGADEADRLGLPSYLEATEAGRPLYEKFGYETVDVLHVDFSKWGGPADGSCCLMLRPPKKSG